MATTQTLTVMMLGGSRRVSMAELLKRAGQRLGYHVKIVAYELDTEVPIALEGKVVKGLRWEDPDILDDIARVVKEFNVNVILPFVNGAMETAALCKQRFPDVFVPISDPAVTSTMYDKIEAAKAFKKAGLPIPRTYSILDNEMPVIVKPRKGGSSRGIKIFRDVDDLMQLPDIDNYLIQQFIEHNREFTVDSYVSQTGEILVTVPRERLEVMGGESTRTVTRKIPQLIEETQKVVRHFGFTGPVTVQFLYDTDRDRYTIHEVIPRLAGGVICSIYAGAPIPDYILQEALGIKVAPCTDWADNVLMARFQKEAIFFNSTH